MTHIAADETSLIRVTQGGEPMTTDLALGLNSTL